MMKFNLGYLEKIIIMSPQFYHILIISNIEGFDSSLCHYSLFDRLIISDDEDCDFISKQLYLNCYFRFIWVHTPQKEGKVSQTSLSPTAESVQSERAG